MPLDTIEDLSVPELFAMYAKILRRLRDLRVVGTNDAPAGGWAEYLICKHFAGQPAPPSEKSWDVLTPDGQHVQVKARVVFDRNNRGQRQLSTIRSFDFHLLAVVLLDEAHRVWRATLLPKDVILGAARLNSYVNGHRLIATDALLDSPGATDITKELTAIATAPVHSSPPNG